MEGEKRIIEILSELLIENQGMRTELIGIHQRVQKIEDIQVKQSLGIGEIRLSVMKIANTIENYANHEERIKKLEKVVFRQAG
jgi:hypothetical protein